MKDIPEITLTIVEKQLTYSKRKLNYPRKMKKRVFGTRSSRRRKLKKIPIYFPTSVNWNFT